MTARRDVVRLDDLEREIAALRLAIGAIQTAHREVVAGLVQRMEFLEERERARGGRPRKDVAA